MEQLVLTTILSDRGVSQPGKLRYTIPSQPATVHGLLLQKSNGVFELVVWSEKADGANSVLRSLYRNHDLPGGEPAPKTRSG